MKKCVMAVACMLCVVVLDAATPDAEKCEKGVPEKKERDATITLSIKPGMDFAFVKCPAGSFTMGVVGDLDEQSYKREHKVTLTRPFWMQAKKVTWKQWKANGGQIRWWYPKSVNTDSMPIFRVSYYEVQMFCDKMTKRFRAKLPKGCVIRLPTEAEWEYALNANCEDETDPYVAYRDNGKGADKIMTAESDLMKLLPADDLDGIAAIKKQGVNKYLCPVGTKLPNRWGLYDLLSNGGEMTLDTICYGKHDFWEKTELRGKLTYQEEETDPFKYNPWGDVYIARGTKSNDGSHMGSWYAKDIVDITQTKYLQRGFRLVIGPDYIGEWKVKNAAKAKAIRSKPQKNAGK